MTTEKNKKVITLTSIITCPHCGYKKEEEMPTDACQFIMNVKIVKPYSSPSTATAVCIAVTALQSVPQNKPETIVVKISS